MKKVQLIILFILLICFSSFSQESVKVITYNIWNGFEWGKDTTRKANFLAWMKLQQPNVVALQELCGYTPEMLAEDAKEWGHPYSVLLKTTGYPVGLTSQYPIKIKARIMDGMGHGALHCQTRGIDFLVVHLHPGSVQRRQEEANILLTTLKNISLKNSKYIVLGDFNAHSPFDADLYKSNGYLLNRLRKDDKGKGISGNLAYGELDYSVISSFLGTSLIDVVQKQTQGLKERGSYPTRVFEPLTEDTDEQIASRMERIDYILVSPMLAGKCVKAKVCNGEENWYLSDHYPVVAEFKLRK